MVLTDKSVFLTHMLPVALAQGYRRLSVDINAVRQVRRGVQEKWKMILENLGERERGPAAVKC